MQRKFYWSNSGNTTDHDVIPTAIKNERISSHIIDLGRYRHLVTSIYGRHAETQICTL